MQEIAKAMAKAQSEIKSAAKDRDGQSGRGVYKYADLVSVWDACRTALTSNGLSVVQIPGFDENDMWLETMILHTSGQSISGRYPLRPQQQTPQGYGSALTYARRYSLAAMVGVVADDDDDGSEASKTKDVEEPPKPLSAREALAKEALENAKTFVNNCLMAIGQCMTDEAIDAWYASNTAKIVRLKSAYPNEAIYVTEAIKSRRAEIRSA